MIRILHPLPMILASVLLLGGCAAQGSGAPSLAKRSVEGRFDVAPPAVNLEPPGPLPVDIEARLARWEADSLAAQQAFAAERADAANLVSAAVGAAVASENWIAAQQAVSRLVAARAPLTAALADIDALYVERSVAGDVDGMPAIYALRERLAELASAQDAVIEGLRSEMPAQ